MKDFINKPPRILYLSMIVTQNVWERSKLKMVACFFAWLINEPFLNQRTSGCFIKARLCLAEQESRGSLFIEGDCVWLGMLTTVGQGDKSVSSGPTVLDVQLARLSSSSHLLLEPLVVPERFLVHQCRRLTAYSVLASISFINYNLCCPCVLREDCSVWSFCYKWN